MKKQNTVFQWGFCLMLGLALVISGCKKGGEEGHEKKKSLNIVVAKLQPSETRLYFKGDLAPLRTEPVLSPVEGTITKIFFKYGDSVKKNQKIVEIHSEKLAEDYREAVTKYLQAKDAYESGIKSFAGTKVLYQAGIISEDEFHTDQSQYQSKILDFYAARFALEKILSETNINPKEIEKLSILDTQSVVQILQRHFKHIVVKSPGNGIALFPGKSDDSSDNKNERLSVGAEVKRGQLILAIGDLSGFSMALQVSEININKLHPGLRATVTGDAFPGVTFEGRLESVASQANPQSAGGQDVLSMFNIVVEIPNVTEEQRKVVHVGMTANVEIDVKNPLQIILPIQAVFQKNGQNMVTLIDPKTGQQKDVPVVPGQTTLTGVIIRQGVKPGDKVVVHD